MKQVPNGGEMKNEKDNLGPNTVSGSLATGASGAWYNTDRGERNHNTNSEPWRCYYGGRWQHTLPSQ